MTNHKPIDDLGLDGAIHAQQFGRSCRADHRRGSGHRLVGCRPWHGSQGSRGPRLVCGDNLPPELIAQMVDLGLAAGSQITQLAVVMDVRSRGFTGDLEYVRSALAERNIRPRVLFMEASDDVIVRRYENNRRAHPLQGIRP